jgi:hypothetical protein
MWIRKYFFRIRNRNPELRIREVIQLRIQPDADLT